MKGKIIATTIIIPITFLGLWMIVSTGLGVFALIIAAIVIIAVFFILLELWESCPSASGKERE